VLEQLKAKGFVTVEQIASSDVDHLAEKLDWSLAQATEVRAAAQAVVGERPLEPAPSASTSEERS